MNIFLDLLRLAIQDNLLILIGLMFTMALLELGDLGLGFYIGVYEDGFDLRKLIFGLVKRIVLVLSILIIGYATNLFGLLIELTVKMFGGKLDMSIVVSITEIVCVVMAWVIDLLKDLYAKLKGLRTLKYIKYEDAKLDTQNYGEDDNG